MFKSRLPKIAADIGPAMDLAARAAAQLIEGGAKARVPVNTGRLRDAIHIEHEGVGEYTVVAGNGDAFYGHIVEHGSVHTPPHPFLIPAAEEARAAINAEVKAALKAIT